MRLWPNAFRYRIKDIDGQFTVTAERTKKSSARYEEWGRGMYDMQIRQDICCGSSRPRCSLCVFYADEQAVLKSATFSR